MTTCLLAIAFISCGSAIQAKQIDLTVSLRDNFQPQVSGTGVFTLNSNILSYCMSLPTASWKVFALGPGGYPGNRPNSFLMGLCPETSTPPYFCSEIQGEVSLTDAQIWEMLNGLWSVFSSGAARNDDDRDGIRRFTLRGQILPVDTDNDGVPDYRDACHDTPLGGVVDANGCSIEQLCPCDGRWERHGEYMKQLRAITSTFLSDGLITTSERQAIIAEGATSNCGKR